MDGCQNHMAYLCIVFVLIVVQLLANPKKLKMYASIFFIVFNMVMGMGNTTTENKIPSIIVQDVDGKEVNIQEYTQGGKFYLVSLWATWCGPCRTELKALNKVAADWKEKYDLEIIAISLDKARALPKAKKMFTDSEWPYTFLWDDGAKLATELGLRGIPYSMLIGPDGNIISKASGYSPGYEDKIEGKIKAALAK